MGCAASVAASDPDRKHARIWRKAEIAWALEENARAVEEAGRARSAAEEELQSKMRRAVQLRSKVHALELLRDALGRQPIDVDELSLSLDVSREVGVPPRVLAKPEEVFGQLLAKKKAASSLLLAIESRVISSLHEAIREATAAEMAGDDFPGADGVGVLPFAEKVLREEQEPYFVTLILTDDSIVGTNLAGDTVVQFQFSQNMTLGGIRSELQHACCSERRIKLLSIDGIMLDAAWDPVVMRPGCLTLSDADESW